jgi:hypothetical protein
MALGDMIDAGCVRRAAAQAGATGCAARRVGKSFTVIYPKNRLAGNVARRPGEAAASTHNAGGPNVHSHPRAWTVGTSPATAVRIAQLWAIGSQPSLRDDVGDIRRVLKSFLDDLALPVKQPEQASLVQCDLIVPRQLAPQTVTSGAHCCQNAMVELRGRH